MENTTIYLFREFLDIEDENNLFEYQIDDIKIWQYIRFTICARLLEELTGIKTTADSKGSYKKRSVDWITKLKRSQFLVHNREVLFITYARRTLEHGKYRDPITEEITKNLHLKYYVFENEYGEGHFEPVQTKHLKYINREFLYRFLKYNEGKYDNAVRRFVDFLYEIFSEKYKKGLGNDFKRFMHFYITLRLKQIYYNRLYAKLLLGIVRPKVIVLYGAYLEGQQEIVCIGKQKGIPVIELQHGRIGPTHGGYNYKSLHELETFPDYLFVYGQYERENVKYPIAREQIFPVGAPELERKAKLYNSKKHSFKRKIILFTPGSMENEIMLEYAMALERQLSAQSYEIIYKLHPADYADWKIKYPQLKQCSFKIVDNNKHDIYYYLGKSDYVIGISSTSLFEAMMFQTQIIVIRAQDYEKAEAVYNNCGQLVKSTEELINVIKSEKKLGANGEWDFYYRRDAVQNIQRLIKIIINKEENTKWI